MKKIGYCLLVMISYQLSFSQDQVFELFPNQSMLITGKGDGQDGAINPYTDSNSFAIVNNIGVNIFEIRIQLKGDIIEIIPIEPKETKKVLLKKGYELYFDCALQSKVQVNFEPKK